MIRLALFAALLVSYNGIRKPMPEPPICPKHANCRVNVPEGGSSATYLGTAFIFMGLAIGAKLMGVGERKNGIQ